MDCIEFHKQPRRSLTVSEAVLLLLAAALLSVQLLVPPYTGLANNGDFAKISERFSLAPEGGWSDNFIYFAPDYRFAPENFWKSDVLSSEIVLAAVPIEAARALGSVHFNIRWLGLVHCLLFLGGYYALLLYLRRLGPQVQAAVGLAVLCIIGDAAYVAYFNSFFSDTAAVLGLLLAVAFGLHLAAEERPNLAALALFTGAALLFVTSKTQHGVFAFLPALFAAAAGWRFRETRAAGTAAGAILLLAFAVEFGLTPVTYSGQPLFNLVFFKLTPESAAPLRDLQDLGLAVSDLRYSGTHAYMPGSPAGDPGWVTDFVRRGGYGRLAAFYLRRPGRALQFLREDLDRETRWIRCPNLSNFRRVDGRPAGALTQRFAWWSGIRSRLFGWWPGHVIVWYLAVMAGCVAIARRNVGAARRTAALCLGIAVLGVLEFCFASLTDACETYRHLLLFHLLTDVTVCFALAWALTAAGRRAKLYWA